MLWRFSLHFLKFQYQPAPDWRIHIARMAMAGDLFCPPPSRHFWKKTSELLSLIQTALELQLHFGIIQLENFSMKPNVVSLWVTDDVKDQVRVKMSAICRVCFCSALYPCRMEKSTNQQLSRTEFKNRENTVRTEKSVKVAILDEKKQNSVIFKMLTRKFVHIYCATLFFHHTFRFT